MIMGKHRVEEDLPTDMASPNRGRNTRQRRRPSAWRKYPQGRSTSGKAGGGWGGGGGGGLGSGKYEGMRTSGRTPTTLLSLSGFPQMQLLANGSSQDTLSRRLRMGKRARPAGKKPGG